ncbi:glutathione S-transferase N-terminal domain-containing protein [Caulobacter sp. UNC279MFTsu5.1]|uniref:glutathione S-transferase N-terminal domain-containing protein n=1 Tax=Caulobacter sp. UNC279MFTsu5.1 TaxID=1502775 RepID=UPI0008F40AED|nr:glutathione S-transferase N-terminal domain-containing protein [Caulobacter sp. UNC279MFTsu5.1]SFJ98081.1 glutathione S-transferase [Caulobacter sp. UNC279MFTsu5.1]
MKLFFAPGFSSLADHIALLEAGVSFEIAKVDPESKRLADGGDYRDVNPKGQVPALMLDDGQVLTENVAILAWVADRAPDLAPPGELGRYRLLEMLAFIASEIHKRFPIYFSLSEEAAETVARDIVERFDLVAPRVERGYLLGDAFGVADAYLFVMARGALQLDFPLGAPFENYVARIEARPAVRAALSREAAEPPPGP